MTQETLALIMPGCREPAIAGELPGKWESTLERLGLDYRIFVYNDGCGDDSPALLHNYVSPPGRRVTVIDPSDRGRGPAILRTCRECSGQYDWIFLTDADGGIAPESFVKLWEMRNDYDFIVGNCVGRGQNGSRLLSKLSAFGARMLYDGKWSEVNGPCRLMRSSACGALFDTVPEKSFAPDGMLGALAAYYGLRCAGTTVAPCESLPGGAATGRSKPVWGDVLSFWQLFRLRLQLIRYPKLLQMMVLSFVLAVVCLLFPERHDPVGLAGYTAASGVSVFDFYAKQPLESIQQIELEMVWRLKKKPAADDVLFMLPNARLEINPSVLTAMGELDPGRLYACKLHLYDDFGVLYGGAPPELKELSRKIGRAQYIKTDASQLLLINNDLVALESLRGEITVDSLLPKIFGALLALMGTVTAIIFCTKTYGAAPTGAGGRKLAAVALTVTAGLLIALATCRGYQAMGRGFPYDTFLFFPEDRFNDLFNTFSVVRFWAHPYLEPIPGAGYFPFSYLLFKLIPSSNQWYVIFFAFAFFISFYLVSASAICRYRGWPAMTGLLAILLLNYPLWFMLDRGNTDFFVYIFIFLFAWFYRKQQDWAAIFCLICAVNLKLYPAILAVLYLKDRAYRQFFAAALGSVALLLFSFAYYDWDFAGFLKIMKVYNGCYVAGMEGVIYGHSLYGLVKVTANRLWDVRDFTLYEHVYWYVAMFLAAGVSFYVIRIEKVLWKNLYLLIAMMLLLPHTSFDYRMIVLVIPMLYFLVDESEPRHWLLYSIFWGLLLMPIHWVFAYRDTQLSVFLRPLLLAGLALYIICCGLRQRYCGKRRPDPSEAE